MFHSQAATSCYCNFSDCYFLDKLISLIMLNEQSKNPCMTVKCNNCFSEAKTRESSFFFLHFCLGEIIEKPCVFCLAFSTSVLI